MYSNSLDRLENVLLLKTIINFNSFFVLFGIGSSVGFDIPFMDEKLQDIRIQ